MIYEQSLLIGRSKIHIKSDRKEAISEAIREIRRHIMDLSDYIRNNPYFQYSLEPLDMDYEAPLIVQRMIEASKKASVGPMASVAGALADLGLKTLLKMGAKVAVVENGGEISAFTSSENIPVSILTSEPALSGKIGFLITSRDSPLGIGTSTGKTNRTISFGEANSVTVVAENAALADAAATAVCNAVVGSDIEKSILEGLKKSKNIRGVRGALIVREGHIGLMGKLPKIIKIKES